MRRRLRIALGAAAALIAATLTPVTPANAAAVACTVVYTTNDWDTGFTANVSLTNNGPALSGWQLTWTFLDGQRVQQGWGATFGQSGAKVTATNLSYNGNLATGASTSIGFNGSKGSANRPPTDFAVNGTACTGPNQAPTVSLTSPKSTDSYNAPATIPLAATAADSDGTISKVEFYAGDTLLATDTTAPYASSWTNVPAGTYSVTTKAYDDKGASTSTTPVSVKVLSGPTIVASPATLNVKQGSTATFDVTLASAPTSNVTVGVSRTSGSTDLTATPASLTFTPSNWRTAQNVTVTSADSGAVGSAVFTAAATGYASATVTATEVSKSTSDYEVEFLKEYNKIKDLNSGYFRKFGNLLVPYHSVETLMVEAPDYGHETTSEAFSYYLWLEAAYGRITQDWAPFNAAWSSLETFAIPSAADQPSNSGYNASKPATYAAEYPSPSKYPSQLQTGVSVGSDPIAGELKSAYGAGDVYGMHWLLDVDNIYGFGHCEDATFTAPAFINTFQRGSQESVWETVTQPSCDQMKYGGKNGYLDLFTGDSSYAKQWKYTDAPDADARAVQVAFQAEQWAKAQGKSSAVADVVKKASKMGDYLRYSLFDKYFKKIGSCVGASTCPAGSGKDSEHYLISWYYAWGGSLDPSNVWAWRIGDGATHQGYQNPLAAYALSTDPGLKPVSATGASDWATSLGRQLEFLQWLQSSEGGIAGGATNSWDGQYGTPPAGDPTFYGMCYDWQPVWHDPPSNQWFGFQTWGMERVAEYYQATKDARAKKVLDKWVPWAIANTTVGGGGSFQIPSDLTWTGAPDTWNASNPGGNSGLHVAVKNYSQDVGVAGSLAKTLMYYAAASGDTASKTLAEGLLTALMGHEDAKGIAVPETRADYNRFDDAYNGDQGLYVPPGWTGTMPNGDPINANSTFLSIRSFYRQDPDWFKVQSYLDGGPAPTFTYHRFWAQSEIATAFAAHVTLFG